MSYKKNNGVPWDVNLKRKWDNAAVIAFREERGELKGRIAGELKGRIEGELKGRIEGELKGRIEGELKRNIAIVRNMKDKNFSTEVITEITGLSIEEVNKLLER